MRLKNNIYNHNLVLKPWGSEYVIYSDKNKFAITYLCIKPGKETSLHCHSKKKTGFIILSSIASVQIGIYKKNTFTYKPMSRLVFREGLFHRLRNNGKKNLYALEFESPYNKNDLIRFKDAYGRIDKRYETENNFKNINSYKFVKFKKPKKKKLTYILNNKKITLKFIDTYKDISVKGENLSVAILEGRVVDSHNQIVIKEGEIVKANTLIILCKKFFIKKKLLILEIKN